MKKQSGLGIFGILVISLAAAATVIITTGMAIVILRRRRSYKRNSNGSAYAEDVRFLTSDEALDFNLAKPATEFEEL